MKKFKVIHSSGQEYIIEAICAKKMPSGEILFLNDDKVGLINSNNVLASFDSNTSYFEMSSEKSNSMVESKSWSKLRETGLVLLINQILHAFGWALVFELDGEIVKSVYPARVKYRGFDGKIIGEQYSKINKYMLDNAESLYKESLE